MKKAGAPYLLFLGDVQDELSIKGCTGVTIWRPEKAHAQIRLEGGTQDLGLPNMAPAEAAAAGCQTMLVGVANAGGFVPEAWVPTIIAALEAGLDVMAGMHKRMADIPEIAAAAAANGRTLFDVRQPVRLEVDDLSTASNYHSPASQSLLLDETFERIEIHRLSGDDDPESDTCRAFQERLSFDKHDRSVFDEQPHLKAAVAIAAMALTGVWPEKHPSAIDE